MPASLFGLLTRIRLPGAHVDLETIATKQHLFPFVGLVVGAIAALMALGLNHLLDGGDALISGALLVTGLYLVTGIMHTEGLADLVDGIMAGGGPERKREVMKDPRTGVGAVMAVTLYIIILFTLAAEMCWGAPREISSGLLPWAVPFAMGFVVSEMGGKLAINTSMFLGPSSHEGMGSSFVRAASPARFAGACALAGVLGLLAAGLASVILFTGVLAGAVVTLIARKHLGGVSGDVFGAANEIGRLLPLILWVLIV